MPTQSFAGAVTLPAASANSRQVRMICQNSLGRISPSSFTSKGPQATKRSGSMPSEVLFQIRFFPSFHRIIKSSQLTLDLTLYLSHSYFHPSWSAITMLRLTHTDIRLLSALQPRNRWLPDDPLFPLETRPLWSSRPFFEISHDTFP